VSRRPSGSRRRDREQPGRAEDGGGRGAIRPLLAQGGLLIGVFAVVALVAKLAGAANLGVAFGIGQVAFAIALLLVLLRT
jgi:hypothetical protein